MTRREKFPQCPHCAAIQDKFTHTDCLGDGFCKVFWKIMALDFTSSNIANEISLVLYSKEHYPPEYVVKIEEKLTQMFGSDQENWRKMHTIASKCYFHTKKDVVEYKEVAPSVALSDFDVLIFWQLFHREVQCKLFDVKHISCSYARKEESS